MKTLRLILLVLAPCALSACDAGVQGLGQAADRLRIATEHMAADSAEASKAREAKILADGEAILEHTSPRDGFGAGDQNRYEVRADNGSWAVYDRNTGQPVRSHGIVQTGLSRTRAERALESLEDEGASDTGGEFGARPSR